MATILPAQHQTANKPSKPKRILAIGDSLVYGYGDHVGGGWVERLRRHWMNPQTPNHVLYNLGVRGDTVAQVTQRLKREFNSRGELRNQVPDLLILSVGVNDSPRLGRLDGKPYTPLDTFRAQLSQLLDQAQNLCPVLFVGMVPVNEAQMPFCDCLYFNQGDQREYKEATKLACLVRDIPYLDLFELWQQQGQSWINQHLGPDGLHPSVAGYEVILNTIQQWPAFQTAIAQSN